MGTVGDAAVALLKAGAEADKRDGEGKLAFELAPDKEVSHIGLSVSLGQSLTAWQVRKYIERAAEMEGIDL